MRYQPPTLLPHSYNAAVDSIQRGVPVVSLKGNHFKKPPFTQHCPLAQALQNTVDLLSLTISKLLLKSALAKEFHLGFEKNASIKKVILEQFQPETITELDIFFDGLLCLRNFAKLEVIDTALDAEHIDHVLQKLGQSQLAAFRLFRVTVLSNTVRSRFLQFCSSTENLQSLKLVSVGFTPDIWLFLVRGVSYAHRLRYFYVEYVDLDKNQAAIMKLLDSIRESSIENVYRRVTELNFELVKCSLPQQSAVCVARFLQCSDLSFLRWKVINLSYNRIGMQGLKAVCAAVARNNRITSVDVRGNIKPSKRIYELAALLQETNKSQRFKFFG